jgi:hypothetical protein
LFERTIARRRDGGASARYPHRGPVCVTYSVFSKLKYLPVLRHGARLDAADPAWHLTSPTPYDAPLTFGGWNQSRLLGSRISRILTAGAYSPALSPLETAPPPKRQKIIIHTSPFLRCVQTSIGIGAGIAQHGGSRRGARRSIDAKASENRRKTSTTYGTAPSHENNVGDSSGSAVVDNEDNGKPILRVDAFLGEWLSPEYFENITSPPESTLMTLSAKAELLFEEAVEVGNASAAGHFPGGWTKSNDPIPAATRKTSTGNAHAPGSRSAMAYALQRVRSSSYSLPDSSDHPEPPDVQHSSAFVASMGYYSPPVPAYAVSPIDPIPRGYVAHARNACLAIDYRWDSMKYPQEWGDGGELGEEWSAMHRRFRGGLDHVVSWYRHHIPEYSPEPDQMICQAEDEDEDYELVVILVTHAAGCNALIGALTNQPVLMDVPQASLTLAVRKSGTTNSIANPKSPTGREYTSENSGTIANEYEVKLKASADHLRPGSELQSFASLASHVRVSNAAGTVTRSDSTSSVGAERRGRNTSLGSVRRPSNSPSFNWMSSAAPSRTTSRTPTGLWSPSPSRRDSAPLDGVSDPQTRTDSPMGNPLEEVQEADEDTHHTDTEKQPAPGLWMPSLTRVPTPRDIGPKRRWTTVDDERNGVLTL